MKKKILNFILLLTLGFICVLAGCTQTSFNANMKILPSEQSINITLGRVYEEGLAESTKTFTVDVLDAEDSTVLMEYGENIKVNFVSGYGTEKVVATVQGLTPGTSRITIYSPNNSDKKAYITVRVYSAIETVSFVDNFSCLIEVGGKGAIDVTKDLVILPNDGNKDDISYEIVGETLGATINEKTGVIDATYARIGSISVKVSVKDEHGVAYTEDIRTIQFVEALKKEDVSLENVTTGEKVDLSKGLSLVKTMESYSTNEVRFTINTTQDVAISVLSYKSTIVSVQDVGNYSFVVGCTNLGETYITFSVNIKGAGAFVTPVLIVLPVEVIDAPTDMSINGQLVSKNVDGFKLNVYNSYDNSMFGTEIRLAVTPSSVLEKDAKIRLEYVALAGSDSMPNTKLVVMDENGKTIDMTGRPEIDGGSSIYVSALPDVIMGTFYIRATVVASETYLVNNKVVYADITLNVKEGATSLEIDRLDFSEDGLLYVDKNSEGYYLQLLASPERAEITDIRVESSNNNVIVEPTDDVLVHKIIPNKVGITKLTFTTPNGKHDSCNIRVYVPLDISQTILTCDSPYQNGAVALKETDSKGSLKKIVLATNRSVKINIQTNENADYYAEYVKGPADKYTFEDGLLSVHTRFTDLVATVAIYPTNGEKYTLNFLVEAFIPISSLTLNTLQASLKDADSVGSSYADQLSKLKLEVKTYPQNATSLENADNIKWKISDESVLQELPSDNHNQLIVYAPKLENTEYATVYVSVEVVEFSKTYSVTCEIVVTRAQPVERLILNNVVNGDIYFDGRQGLGQLDANGTLIESSIDLNYKIDYTVYPSNADNKTVKFIYRDSQGREDVPIRERVFTVDRFGRVIPLKAGTATLILAAESSLKSDGIYTVSVPIQVTVADGKTRATALRVSSKTELRAIGTSEYTMGLCYMLSNDINIGDDGKPWTPIGSEKQLNFTGELSGAFRIFKEYDYEDQVSDDYNDLNNFRTLYSSKIYGMIITDQSFNKNANSLYAGLFYRVGEKSATHEFGKSIDFNGSVRDLVIEASVDVGLANIEKPVYYGAVAGSIISEQSQDRAGIVNCTVKYTLFRFITGKSEHYIGGVVGYSMAYINASVTYKSSKTTMSIFADVVSEKLYVGGLVGYADTKIYLIPEEDAYYLFRSRIVGEYKGNELASDEDVVYIFGDGETFADTTFGLQLSVTGTMPAETYTGTSSNLAIGGIVGFASTFTQVKDVSVISEINAEEFDYVGGIAGYSKGQLTNVYSASKINAKTYVGGIAGYVGGTREITPTTFDNAKASGAIGGDEVIDNFIRLAAVENYYHGSTNSGYLISAVSQVGGIAGGLQAASVEYSYVLNFIKDGGKTVSGINLENNPSNAGSLIGAANNATIIGCNTDFGEVKFLGNGSGTTTITDSYTRYNFNLSSGIKTSYVRDYNDVVTIYSSDGMEYAATEDDIDEDSILRTFYELGFETYRADNPITGVWLFAGSSSLTIPSNINDGLPVIVYNKNLILNVAQESLEIIIKETGDFHIKVEEDSIVDTTLTSTTKKVILYLYDIEGNKTAAVKQTLMAKNTFDILDVIDLSVSPRLFKTVRLKVQIDDVNEKTGAISKGSSRVLLENGKLRTAQEGLVRITISSVYNPDACDYFYAYVVKRIQKFIVYDTLNYHEGSYQYQGNAELRIRKNTFEYIYPALLSQDLYYEYSVTSLYGIRYSVPVSQKNNICFVDEGVKTTFDTNTTISYFQSYIDNGCGINASGQVQIFARDAASERNNFIAEPYYKLNFPVDDSQTTAYRVFFAGTGEVDNKAFKVTVYEGAFEITSKVESASYSPSDTVVVELTMLTDIQSDALAYSVVSDYADTLDVVKLERVSIKESIDQKGNSTYEIKFKATISLRYDYQSRYFNVNREFNFRFYSVLINEIGIDVNITYVPQKLGRIDLQFYSSFDEITVKPSSNEVRRKTPGLIMIDLYPFYSNTDYVEIVSESVNGVYLNFEQVQYQTYDKYYKTVTPAGVIVEDGFGLRLRKISEGNDYGETFTGKYYVRTQLSREIDEDMTLSFTVNAYTLNRNTGVYEKVLSTGMTLLAKESDSVTVEVVDTNGLNYVVKGTTSQIKVTLKGEYSKLAYEGSHELPNGIARVNPESKEIFKDASLQKIFYNNATKGVWLDDTTVVYYDTIYVGIGVPSGTKIAINVKLNSLEEQISVQTQTTLTVVDFLIGDVKLNTSTFNSSTNAAKIKVLEYYKIGIESIAFNAAPTYTEAVAKYSGLELGIEDHYYRYYYGYLSDGKNLIQITNTNGLFKLKVFPNYINDDSIPGYSLTPDNIANIEKLTLYVNYANEFYTDNDSNLVEFAPYKNLVSAINSLLEKDIKEGEINTNSFEFIDGIMQKIGNVKKQLRNNMSVLSLKQSNTFVGITETSDYSKFSYTITTKDSVLNDYTDETQLETIYYLIGKSISSNEGLKLNVKYFFNADGEFVLANGMNDIVQLIDYVKDYRFDVVSASDFDDPFPIYSAGDLMAMEDGESYILMNDITLTDWEPLDTEISSLDGNGFVIKLQSFAYDTAGGESIELGLFSTVSESTMLKNITLNIHELEVVDLQGYKKITIGLLAANNAGIITNCVIQGYDKKINTTGFGFEAVVTSVVNGNMVVTGYMNSMYKQYSFEVKSSQAVEGTQVESTIGVLVANNTGSITHSRVGAVKSDFTTTAYDTQITVKASGILGGFVAVNDGQIASSYVSNIYMLNSSGVAGDSMTAGFVTQNSGRVSTSYVKGSDTYNKQRTQEGFLRPETGGIMSNGAIGGFVFTNSGQINDSYSNIAIQSYSSRTAGFVVTNNESGVISTCYSASDVGSNSLSHTPFTGFNQYSEIDNKGKIERSVYMKGRGDNFLVDKYGELAKGVSVSDFGTETEFNGFSFSSSDYEAVWGEISATEFPELTAANNIAFSQRIRSDSGDIITDSFGQVINVSLYEYTSERLGSSSNPYILRNAEEYNYYFNNDATTNEKGELVISEKHFRIVSDIDFDEAAGELATKSITMNACNIEGNGFKLSNVRINADKDEKVDSVGLFKKLVVENANSETINGSMISSNKDYGGIVKNLTIGISEANAVGVNYVGGLAGIIDGYNIFNIDIVSDSQDMVVQGKNIVGGLAGYITGNAKVFTINVSVPVQATYKNASQSIPDYFSGDVNEVSELSHAGAVAGICDVIDVNVYAQDEISLIDNANIKFIKATGNISIYADYAGGLFGYFGTNSHLLDGRFYVSDEFDQSIISGYAAGGLVGINFGVINHSVIEHERDAQKAIDEEIFGYFTKGSYNRKDTDLYQGTPAYLGGIAGINYQGYINYSYSRIDVYDPNPKDTSVRVEQYVGGLAGKTVAGVFKQSFSTSDVLSKNNNYSYAGGLFGRMEAYTSQDEGSGKIDYIYPDFDTVFLLNIYDVSKLSAFYTRNDGRNFGLIAGYSTFDFVNCVKSDEQVEEGEGTEGEGTENKQEKPAEVGILYAEKMQVSSQLIYQIGKATNGANDTEGNPIIKNFIGSGNPLRFVKNPFDSNMKVFQGSITDYEWTLEPLLGDRGDFYQDMEADQWIMDGRFPILSLESMSDITNIYTAEDFLLIASSTGKIFQVCANIDLSGYEFTNYVINKNFTGILRSGYKIEGQLVPVTITGIYLFGDGNSDAMGIFKSLRRAQFININFEFAAYDSTKTVLKKSDGSNVFNSTVQLNPQDQSAKKQPLNTSHEPDGSTTKRNNVNDSGKIKQAGAIAGSDESSLYSNTTVRILTKDSYNALLDSYYNELVSIFEKSRTEREVLVSRIQELLNKLTFYSSEKHNSTGIESIYNRFSTISNPKIREIAYQYVTNNKMFDKGEYNQVREYLENKGNNPMKANADKVGGFAGFGAGAISVTSGSFFIGSILVDATALGDSDKRLEETYVGGMFGTVNSVRLAGSDYLNIDINVKTASSTNVYVGGVVGSASILNMTCEAGDVTDVRGKINLETTSSAMYAIYVGGIAGSVLSGNIYNPEVDLPITIETTGGTKATAAFVGGVAGSISSTNIYNAIVNTKLINGSIPARAIGFNALEIGGFAGEFISSNITNAKLLVDITQNWKAAVLSAGGFAGEIQSQTALGEPYNIINCFVTGKINAVSSGTYAAVGGVIGRFYSSANIGEGATYADYYINQTTSNVKIDFNAETTDNCSIYLGGIIGSGLFKENSTVSGAGVIRIIQSTTLGKINSMRQRTDKNNLSMFAGGVAGFVGEGAEIQYTLTATTLSIGGYGKNINNSGTTDGNFVGTLIGRVDNNKTGSIKAGNNISCSEVSGVIYVKANEGLISYDLSQEKLIAYLYATFPQKAGEAITGALNDSELKKIYTNVVGLYTVTAYWDDIITGYIEFTTPKLDENANVQYGADKKPVKLQYSFANKGEYVYDPYIVLPSSGGFEYREFAGLDGTNGLTIKTNGKVVNDVHDDEKYFLLNKNATLTRNFDYELNGVFNANYKILTIDSKSLATTQADNSMGLFNKIGKTGVLSNVAVEITGTGRSLNANIGAVAGTNEGIIVNAFTKGILSSKDSVASDSSNAVINVAGLVAINKGTIISSQSDIEIHYNNKNALSKIAGSVAFNDGGTLYNICVMGNLENESDENNAIVGAFVAESKNGVIFKVQVTISLSNIAVPSIKTLTNSHAHKLVYDKQMHIKAIEGVASDILTQTAKTTDDFIKSHYSDALFNVTNNIDAMLNYGYAYLSFISTFRVTGSTTPNELISTGNGEKKSPIQITNLVKLQRINDLKGSYYELKYNLDFMNFEEISPWLPIGNIDDPFTGHFEGNGKYINNFEVETTSLKNNLDNNYLGFFGVLKGAKICETTSLDLRFKETMLYGVINSYGYGQDSNKKSTKSQNGLSKFVERYSVNRSVVDFNDESGRTYYPERNAKGNNNTSPTEFTVSLTKFKTESIVTGVEMVVDKSCVGTLAGLSYDSTVIKNVNISGQDGADINVYAFYAGGLVGYISNTTIENVSISNLNVYGEHGVGYYGGESDYKNSQIYAAIGELEKKGLSTDIKLKYYLDNTSESGLGYSGTQGGYAGGITGVANGSTVRNCNIDANIVGGHGGDGANGGKISSQSYTYYYDDWGEDYVWTRDTSKSLKKYDTHRGGHGGDGGASGYAGGIFGGVAKANCTAMYNTVHCNIVGGNGGNGGNGHSGGNGGNGNTDSKLGTIGTNGLSGGAGGNGGSAKDNYGFVSGTTLSISGATSNENHASYTHGMCGAGGDGGTGGGGGNGAEYWRFLWMGRVKGMNGSGSNGGPGGTNGNGDSDTNRVHKYDEPSHSFNGKAVSGGTAGTGKAAAAVTNNTIGVP